jgi:nucleoside-diphosphate-sugar epimerase
MMRALLTGATSFSGYWFAVKLQAAGFRVVAPLRASHSTYTAVRGERVKKLNEVADVVGECPFGSAAFLNLIATADFDVLCHHAARVVDYRSLDFDIPTALAENTNNLRTILERMQPRGLKAVIFTGSVFEANEGAGNEPMRAFSPYGLSKGFTGDVFRYWCTHYNVPFGKFLIANPFGPLEEPRFCAYLIRTWSAGRVAEVRTPTYLRDNIHIDLLALAYANFVKRTIETQRSDRLGPMGYVETQGAFSERYAQAMRPRLGLDCGIKLLKQTDFSEPLVRINTHPIDPTALGWSESNAWDGIADYYRTLKISE